MHPEVKALMDHFHFTPLPAEGTLFVSTYRSAQELDGGKPYGTAMIGMYCDDPPSLSRFHHLPVDEVWHFYAGDPLRLILLHPDGSSEDVIMGNDPLKGQRVQFVIPAGTWQAGHMLDGGRYSLFGGTPEQLVPAYPDRADDIQRFGCEPEEPNMPKGFAQ